jgi:uncharacterized protein YbjQ (UPF0145 family)
MATGEADFSARDAPLRATTAAAARLPVSARARLDRAGAGTARTSFLSVPSAAGLHAVGLDPIGDVMGCVATQVSQQWVGLCAQSTRTGNSRVVLSTNNGATRFTYVGVLNSVYRTALSRLRDEARGLGADGVVGVRLTRTVHEQLHEVVAIGTAVRARSRRRPTQPFTTDLSGTDVAKLMLSNWVPVSLHVAVQLGVRHNDYTTISQLSYGNRSNVEVTGFSDLLQRTRSGAGARLRSAMAAVGADGGLLGEFDTAHWSKECSQRIGGDEVACTVAVGTSIARFGSSRDVGRRPLSILPVNTKEGRR